MPLLAGLLFLLAAAWAQQPAKCTPAPTPHLPDSSGAASEPASQILDENRNSVVLIVAAGNTSLKLGTGFFVRSAGLLLTNLHVVEGTDLVGVKVPGGNAVLWAKRATGFDVDNDLVLLEVETAGVKPVRLGDSDGASVGEQIVVVGNPEGLEQTVSNGLLSGIREVDGRKVFQISAPASEGSSGSPVFNGRGEVVAVVVSSLESGQNLNFAIPINYAKPLLSRVADEEISALPRRKRSVAEPRNGTSPDGAAGPAGAAVEAMSKTADELGACQGNSWVTSVAVGKKKHRYVRMHSDAPTDVRFDVKTSDSLVAPFQGVLEFSIHVGVTYGMPTADEAAAAADFPPLSRTTRYRYFYRINGSTVRLDYRTFFDDQRQDWILEQGKSDMCWDRVGSQ